MKMISEKEIVSKMTPNGGFTKKQLAEWGVPWPPLPGWKKHILKNGVPSDEVKQQMDKECDANEQKEITSRSDFCFCCRGCLQPDDFGFRFEPDGLMCSGCYEKWIGAEYLHQQMDKECDDAMARDRT